MLSVGLINGMVFWSAGLFIAPLEDQFGWSRAQVSFAFSLSHLVAGLASPVTGRLVDRGPRRVIRAGLPFFLVSYLLLANLGALWQWYIFIALQGIVVHFIFIIPYMSLVGRWFDRRRSLTSALLGTGLMGGAMVMVPVMRLMIDWLGWDGAYLFAALLSLVALAPLALFVVRDSPADVGAAMDGRPHSGRQSSAPAVAGVTLGTAVRSRLFWTLAFGMTLYSVGQITLIVHSAPLYESFGVSAATAALLISLTAGVAIVPRLVAGAVAASIQRLELAAMAVALIAMTSALVLVISTSALAIGIFLAIWIVAFGCGGWMFQALLIPRAFGVAHFGAIAGTMMITSTLGTMAAPTVAGAIFDSTGSYHWALVMLVGTFAASAVSFFFASRAPRPLFHAAAR